MTYAEEAEGESARCAALDAWVAAFDRELEQNGDFARGVAAMAAHGCFDVRAVVERWMLANPTGSAPIVRLQPALQEAVPVQRVLEEVPALEEVPTPEAAEAPREPAVDGERRSPLPEGESSPDIAYFHSLLQGGIARAQLYEAFPRFRFVIDEAVGQHEAAAPILSEVPPGPSRQDLDDEIRGIRQELRAGRKPERRRWRRD